MFETMFESIWQVVAYLWERKGKISGCFKNSTQFFSSNVEIKYIFKEMILAFSIISFCILGNVNNVVCQIDNTASVFINVEKI